MCIRDSFVVDHASHDDSDITRQLIDRLNNFSVLIAHNGIRFDVPMLNTRALAAGIRGLSPGIKHIDPCKIAWRHLNMQRNSLDAIAAFLQLDEGKYHIGPEVWVRAALDRDKQAMKTLVERCESDVRVLEDVASYFLPLTRSFNGWGSA